MIKSLTPSLLNLKGLSHKELIDKYKSVLEQVIRVENASERLEEMKSFIDLLINESVGLVVSRQLFADLSTTLTTMNSDAASKEDAKTVANYALEKIQPRAISFEDQVTSFRQLLADIYESESDWRRAATILSGIPLETSQK